MTADPTRRGRLTAVTDADRPRLIAHRGFAGCFPENTLTAVRAAAATPETDGIEIDVVPTRDDRLVVFHDDDLSRLTDAPASVATHAVWELPYAELSTHSVVGTDQPIALLADVLDALPPALPVNIECKHPGREPFGFDEPLSGTERSIATDRWRGFIGRVLDAATAVDNPVVLSSFYEGALAATRELDASMPLAVVFSNAIGTGLELADRYDTEAIHLRWNMVDGDPYFSRSVPDAGPFASVGLIERAHAEERAVNVWTVRTWREAIGLARAGVDGLIADYPGVVSIFSSPNGGSDLPETENH